MAGYITNWLGNLNNTVKNAVSNVGGTQNLSWSDVSKKATAPIISAFSSQPAQAQTSAPAQTPTVKPQKQLPSVDQYNQNFMANNPQFGNAQTGAVPSAPQQGMSSYVPPATPTPPVQTEPPPAAPVQPSYQPAVNPGGTATAPNYSNQVQPGTAGAFQTAIQQQLGLGLGGGQQAVNPEISRLMNISQNQTPEVQQAGKAYQDFITKTEPGIGANQAALAMDPRVGSGRGSIVSNQLAQTAQGLGTAYSAAVQGEQQQVGAAQQAGNLAQQGQQQGITALQNVAGAPGIAPQLGQYGQTFYQMGQQGGSNLDPQTYAAQIADQIYTGKMSPQDGKAALGYAGSAGDAFLQQAMKDKHPDFNWNQAQQNIQTQGLLAPAAQNATSMLKNLDQTLKTAPWYTNTGIPVLDKFTRLASSLTGVGAGGTEGTQAVRSAIVDARTAMANALGVANNQNPSAYTDYVNTLVPDGINSNTLPGAIQQFDIQMKGKLGAFESPGTTQAPQAGGTSQNTAAGGALVRNAQGLWVQAQKHEYTNF